MQTARASYRPTESKYKGGAHEMYVVYTLEQRTRNGGHAMYPKVKRVYIAGEVAHWKAGVVKKRSGRAVHGVLIRYTQKRMRYRRKGYTASRGGTTYEVSPASVRSASQTFTQVVEVPAGARNMRFFTGAAELPPEYRNALQDVR